jgi:FixJ family two-component response regulator
MSPVTKPSVRVPRILVVDDEPTLLELVGDLVAPQVNCRVLSAPTIKRAREILATESIDVLLADIHLPDGDGLSLIADLQRTQPAATAIVITGAPTVDRAITAIRTGALDFVPKPFSADHLADRVRKAIKRNEELCRTEKRLARLREAVHKLNQSRKLVSKKVDLLCNDLISAYGELAKQFDGVRTQEGFRAYLEQAKDLEQLLCHSMDWILRQIGYCNVAIWLAADNSEFHLGAYMKYTIPGEPPLAEAMSQGLVPQVMRGGFVHLMPEEAEVALSDEELKYLGGQEVLAASSTYLGEPLAAVVLFRDGAKPFTDEDVATLKMISPVFAAALASAVRGPGEAEGPEEDPAAGGTKMDDKEDREDSEWWKRGEKPPF